MNPLRLALRSLARSPAHAFTSLATIVLALASILAVVALSEALFERALPVDAPERLMTLSARVAEPDIADLSAKLAPQATLAAATDNAVALDLGEGPIQVDADLVSSNYFDVVGARLALGRGFGADPATDARAIVLSHAAWRTRFAADPAIVGRSVRVNGAAFEVIGVAPPRFSGVDPDLAPELWLSLDSSPVTMPGWEFRGVREERFLALAARLRPGVSREQLADASKRAAAEMERDFPGPWQKAELLVEPAAATAAALRESMAPVLFALRAGVGALAAVALANLALLALARAGARAGESAVRAALGASARGLFAPAIAESALVALAGSALALLLAPPLAGALAALLPDLRRAAIEFAIDRRLALAAVLGALIATTASAAAAMAATRRSSLAARLAARGAGAFQGRSGAGLRAALVAAEVALALPLVAGAILFARSLGATAAVNPGFDPRGLLTVRLNAQTVGYPKAQGDQVLAAALDAVRATPGVERAAGAFLLPLGFGDISRPIVPAGAPLPPESAEPPSSAYNVVTDGYFETLGVPVVAGREFAASDRSGTGKVVVVSRAMAASLWPGRDPRAAVGEWVELPLDERGDRYEVVGVVGDVRHVALESEAVPFFYLPWRQVYRGRITLVVKSAASDASSLGVAVREAVRRVDPNLPTYALERYDDYVAGRLARPRALATLVGTSAAAAALLAAVGIAGVVAVAIDRRRRELGLRLALGSTPARAMATAAGSGLLPLAAGAALGVLLAGVLSKLAASLVYGVEVSLWASALPGLLVLLALGAASSLLAARRAARLDPSQLLRSE